MSSRESYLAPATYVLAGMIAGAVVTCMGAWFHLDQVIDEKVRVALRTGSEVVAQKGGDLKVRSLTVEGELEAGSLASRGPLRVGTNTMTFLNNVNLPPVLSDLILSDVTGASAGRIGLARFDLDDFSGMEVGIGLGDAKHKLHLHNGPFWPFTTVYTPRPVRTGFTNAATGKTAADGLLVGIDVDGNAEIKQQESLPLSLATAGANRMTITATGEVGIGGSPSPNSRLHVMGNFQLQDGTQAAGRVLTSDAVGVASWQAPSPATMDYAIFADARPSGVHGGAFASGAWRQRVLNTTLAQSGSSIVRSNSSITLQPGTYTVDIVAPALSVRRHQARLVSTTTPIQLPGTSAYSHPNGNSVTNSFIRGELVITGAAQTFVIEHRCQQTFSAGFGVECGFGIDERYTLARIERVN